MQELNLRNAAFDRTYHFKSLEGNFFQSRELHEILQQIGWKTVYLNSQKDRVQTSVLAFAVQDLPLYHSFFPSFRVLYGPCIKTDEITVNLTCLNSLLKNLCREVKRKGAIFLSVATPFPFPCGQEAFHRNGFKRVTVNGEYSVFIDLTKELETIRRGMKRFARRWIKKAEAKGVEIRNVETETELHHLHRLYVDTAARRGFQPYPYSLFHAFWKQLEPKGHTKFFIACLRKKPIAGILNTFYQKESVPYIACSLRKYWNCGPNHLLFWHSLKWSKEVRKAKVFKLYHLPQAKGKGKEIDYHTFKSCFGGDIIEERTIYHKIISPPRFRVLQALQNKVIAKEPFKSLAKQIASTFI